MRERKNKDADRAKASLQPSTQDDQAAKYTRRPGSQVRYGSQEWRKDTKAEAERGKRGEGRNATITRRERRGMEKGKRQQRNNR